MVRSRLSLLRNVPTCKACLISLLISLRAAIDTLKRLPRATREGSSASLAHVNVSR